MLRCVASRILWGAAVVLFLAVLGLYLFQHRLIYHPSRYSQAAREHPSVPVVEVAYHTAQGSQVAFYVPPRDGGKGVPERLWVMFPGNGSLALHSLAMVSQGPRASDAFLFFDYPGYGACEGAPSPETIQESAVAAFAALAATLHTTPETLGARVNTIGHSLGCATSLRFATGYPVRSVILVAPFTTLQEVSALKVGRPLAHLVRHHYDNRARLTELAASAQPPRVTIIHGTKDETIPVRMGRELAAAHPQMIDFHEVPHASHGSVLILGLPLIYEALR